MQATDDQNTKQTHGLGRGLDSLIPTNLDYQEPVEAPSDKISVDLIDPNPQQPRRDFEETALAELAASIRKVGVIQPLLVTKVGDRYQLVAGERRLRASKVAGLKEVPVIVRTFEEQEKLEVAIIENVQRENLNPIELAYSYKKLANDFNLSQEEVAEKVGKGRSTVSNIMRLLALPAEVKQALIEGKITEGHARTILGLSSSDDQIALLHRILSDKLSVRDVEAKASHKVHGTEAKDPHFEAAEKRMGEALATKVTIKHSKKNGKVIIDYYSAEDLERIFRKIVGS